MASGVLHGPPNIKPLFTTHTIPNVKKTDKKTATSLNTIGGCGTKVYLSVTMHGNVGIKYFSMIYLYDLFMKKP